MLGVEERKLLLSQEATYTGQVAAPSGRLALPSKNTGQAGSLFAGQTAGRVSLFRFGKANEELRWLKDEAGGGRQHAFTFLDAPQRALKRPIG